MPIPKQNERMRIKSELTNHIIVLISPTLRSENLRA